MTTIGEKFDLSIQPYAILTFKTDVGHHKVYYYISSRWKSEFFATRSSMLTLNLKVDVKNVISNKPLPTTP